MAEPRDPRTQRALRSGAGRTPEPDELYGIHAIVERAMDPHGDLRQLAQWRREDAELQRTREDKR